MNKLFIKPAIFWLVLASLTLSPAKLLAGGGHDHHGHHNEHTQAPKGPNGGRLLSKGDLSLEISLFENTVPAEMRVFAYWQDQGIKPRDIDLQVALHRLGNTASEQHQVLSFNHEGPYQVSNQAITKPHSFDLEVSARYQNKDYHWRYENHQGRTQISSRMLDRAGVSSQTLAPATIIFKEALFGTIAAPSNQIQLAAAPFPSLIESIEVNIGDRVKKGQVLANLMNVKSTTRYTLKSQMDGEVTDLYAQVGQRIDLNPLMQITDLGTVWVELSAFPENIEKLEIGQQVVVYDLHQHEIAQSTIHYIAPQMTGGHIARARAVLNNSDGHWRPGMHVKAQVEVGRKYVERAVKTSALQRYQEQDVVFAKYLTTPNHSSHDEHEHEHEHEHDKHESSSEPLAELPAKETAVSELQPIFEMRMLELGERGIDSQTGEAMVEVLSGISIGTDYVTTNSYLIKADILKSGAAHDH